MPPPHLPSWADEPAPTHYTATQPHDERIGRAQRLMALYGAVIDSEEEYGQLTGRFSDTLATKRELTHMISHLSDLIAIIQRPEGGRMTTTRQRPPDGRPRSSPSPCWPFARPARSGRSGDASVQPGSRGADRPRLHRRCICGRDVPTSSICQRCPDESAVRWQHAAALFAIFCMVVGIAGVIGAAVWIAVTLSLDNGFLPVQEAMHNHERLNHRVTSPTPIIAICNHKGRHRQRPPPLWHLCPRPQRRRRWPPALRPCSS